MKCSSSIACTLGGGSALAPATSSSSVGASRSGVPKAADVFASTSDEEGSRPHRNRPDELLMNEWSAGGCCRRGLLGFWLLKKRETDQ